ncbi:hypothetical protein H6A29_10810 [Collinsella tanakaei]|nr:hypothetical protein [Collinsella tanakaei]
MSAALPLRTSGSHLRSTEGMLSLRLSEVLWLLGFNALLFESSIQDATGFTYIDEAMTLLLLGAAVKSAVGSKREIVLGARVRTAALLMLSIVCIGLLGNAVWGVQTQTAPIIIDVFTCVKFPVALISACVVFAGSGIALFRIVEVETKIVIAVLLVLGMANLFVDFGMGTEPRYGLRASFVAVFGHPTYLVIACVGLSVILITDWRRNLPWILMALAVTALSLRSKGLVYAALVIALLVLFSRKNRLSALHIAVCVALALLIGYDQFENYFQTDGFARTELLQTSFEVARDYAPLGSGFATYGSAVTAEMQYYSQLYYSYGLSTVYGLIPGEATFLSDTFWPTILGQFGWVGLVLYTGMIAVLFSFAYRLNSKTRLATLCCFLYLLISSTSESAFFNPSAVFLAFCAGFAATAFSCPESTRSDRSFSRKRELGLNR